MILKHNLHSFLGLCKFVSILTGQARPMLEISLAFFLAIFLVSIIVPVVVADLLLYPMLPEDFAEVEGRGVVQE